MPTNSRPRQLGPALAAGIVFFASGAVLVLEILSLRLVAPYLGLTLQTSTAVIGFALGAIAAGAWVGGRIADRMAPQRLLGPILLAAGVLVLFVGPAVRWTGEQVRGGDVSAVLLMAALAVFVPAALLASVTPMVVKLRLATLLETGTVVGRLSGIATLGALVATFATGFLLVAALPTSVILLVLGTTLIALGVVLTILLRGIATIAGPLAVAVIGVVASVSAPAPCDVETAYHCARIVSDEGRTTGRTLHLDTLSHSYVDLADPTHLEFSYIRGMASVIDAVKTGPIRALHLGGGGLTVPRYLDSTRPGSENLVLEIDQGVVDLDVSELGLRLGEGIAVRVQDARVGLAEEPSSTRDVVVGDAFGGLTVPWHLTTRETVAGVRRVLVSDGVYLVNVIDYPPLRFARAEVATIAAVFPHVAILARPRVLRGEGGGNLVIVASNRPLGTAEIEVHLSRRAPELDLLADPSAVRGFIGDAQVLTDDFAPVDQLFTPYSQR
ncbi:MAG: fused MFS/spermidine synthase [Actinobacteria bacterium]|nr:fused MFS/spermidine synthase [Actinomycetota bacterium]